jgi:23S rRNA pseudouridine1911/1915/1917 synthase
MMKKYYVQLKQTNILSLNEAIQKYLKFSKEKTEKLIFQGSVWNNKQNTRLKDKNIIFKNELIVINDPEFPIEEYTLSEKNIKYEDEHFIIYFKEGGVNTCPTPFSDIDCIAHGVQKYYDKKNIKYNVSTINRLDKPTKGLLFYAKNKDIETKLHEMFKHRKIRKLYLALTKPFDLKKTEWIFKDTLEWRGKINEAITYVKYLNQKNDFFYFLVYPMTGRTHQIRKHFKSYLHPIHGDATYGNGTREDDMELICFKYTFKHPISGKLLNIEYLPEKYSCQSFSFKSNKES